MSKNNILIDIYYDLFHYYQDDEIVINAIYHIMRRNNRKTVKSLIRKDLLKLNLMRYEKALIELSNYSNSALDFFKISEFSNLNNITNILNNLLSYNGNDIDLNDKKIDEIIRICLKLKTKYL